MNNKEMIEKYGLTKKIGVYILLQLILMAAARGPVPKVEM